MHSNKLILTPCFEPSSTQCCENCDISNFFNLRLNACLPDSLMNFSNVSSDHNSNKSKKQNTNDDVSGQPSKQLVAYKGSVIMRHT